MNSRTPLLALLIAAPIVSAAADTVLVADLPNRLVRQFDGATGVALGAIPISDVITPWAIACNGERLYVLDQLQSRLYAYDYPSGSPRGLVPHGLTFVLHMTVAANGDLLLQGTSGLGYRITPSGASVATYTPPEFVTGSKGIAEGPNGEIYGANFGVNKIQRYAATGAPQTQTGPSVQNFVDGEGVQIGGGIGYMAHSGTFKVSRFQTGPTPSWLPVWDLSATFNHFLFDAAPNRDGDKVYVCGIDWRGPSPVNQWARVDAATGMVEAVYPSVGLGNPRSIAVVRRTVRRPGDVNGDGTVNIEDFLRLAAAYETEVGDPAYDPDAEFSGDGRIDLEDFLILAANYDG